MKNFYFLFLFIISCFFVTAQTGTSSEVGITEGELSVSLTGSATYSIPIAMPPGINGVVPQVGLVYNSQGGNGLAGYGWNISGISSITRVPSTKFHDGAIDPVDFDSSDRFAFDGQRLIIKEGTLGTYGANDTVYETENFSNVKITSYGVHPNGAKYGPAYFIVLYPDGSKAYYGNSTDSRSIMNWSITYWENPQGVRISYGYNNANNNVNIATIKYGTVGNTPPINTVQFNYTTATHPEQGYIGGQSIINNTILNNIAVTGNGVGFRSYWMGYGDTSLAYQRLVSITEKSGDGSKSYNPTLFTYETTAETITGIVNPTSLGLNHISSTSASTVTGDFDGDGSMDFIVYPISGTDTKKKYWIFSSSKSSSSVDFGKEVPSGAFSEIFPVSYINYQNKLMPLQGWTIIQGNSFKTFLDSSYGVLLQDEKVYNFPRFVLDYTYQCGGSTPQQSEVLRSPIPPIDSGEPVSVHYERVITQNFYNGDFNGDGLTDIIGVEKGFTYLYHSGCATYNTPYPGGRTFFLNLDQRITNDVAVIAGSLEITDNSIIKIADFNGDGKSDIYVFDTGKVKIYTFDESNYFSLLFQTTVTDASIALDKPILLGDYNGDGKTDFIIPKGSGYNEWYKYSSTGTAVIKVVQTYSGFIYPTNTAEYTYNVIPMDYNNDGKTDLLLTSASRGNGYSVGSLHVTCFVNINGSFSGSSGKFYSGSIQNHSDIYTNALPIFLSSNEPNRKLELSFINSNKVFQFNTSKDFSKEQLLKTIKTGNGVTESISYKPLSADSKEVDSSIYSDSAYTENYPNLDIVDAPGFQVVTKVEKTSGTTYKKQLFSYYGAVANVEGRGFLGFRSTGRTNWFDNSSQSITNISKYDIALRGANTENYSVLGAQNLYETVSPSTFITKTILGYTSALANNKVFNIKNTTSQQLNGLDNTSSETTTLYDAYNNPTQSTTIVKQAGVTQQTTISSLTYAQPTANPFVIGRPINKKQSVAVSGSTMTSEEQYIYANSLLTDVKKFAGTDYISEHNDYDLYGNITLKRITYPGLTPRTTSYTYDSSGRFLTKSTDIEGLSTAFVYNTDGTLKTETNPYNLITTYAYDVWSKKIKTTDYLGKSNTYVYTRNGVNSKITTTGDDGSVSEEIFDDLGRKTRSGAKNIDGTMSYVSYLYDIYDRKIKVSEPYNSSATQWNESQFDVYGRLSKSISFTGKTVSMTYTGLVTKVDDGTKTKQSTKNAIGNVVSMKDTPGGIINYTYFANGNLKNSEYGGVNTIIEQDVWGRKTKLTDPSAGEYVYTYNGFGETLTETTPNGTTTYTRDPTVGKITGKKIETKAGGAVSTTTYDYNSATKLLTSTLFKDDVDVNQITTTYVYDTSKRLSSTTEITPYATFVKQFTYDAFGRILNETSNASANGKSSIKTIQNTYKNGQAWQIIDIANSQVLWQTNTVNARGQLATATLGNSIAITNTYDTYGYISKMQHNLGTANLMKYETAFDAARGNLLSRNNSFFNRNETFQYDTLDRLTEYTNGLGIQETQTYDDKGRITQNNVGTYEYDATKTYQNKAITLTPEALGYYGLRDGIFNDSMEDKMDWGAVKSPATTFYSYDATKSHTGKYSLKFANTTTTQQYTHSDKWISIDNAVATEYTFSAWVYTDNPEAELHLFMKTPTETNYYTQLSTVKATVKNQWYQLIKTVLVPANIKKLNIRLDNNGLGNIWFDDVQIRKTSDISTATSRQLNITYNTFKSPVLIDETGVDKISFNYNDGNDRSSMFYGGLQDDKLLRTYRKHYSADGTMEVKYNTVTGAVEFITYIGGDGYSAPVVLKSDGTTQNYLYLHRDYQGTIVAITNQAGAVVEKRLFDAWGNVVKAQDGAGNILAGLTILDRGYTGHEHLQSVGLIHMNGRLYDPKLHRFLQPDNYVQEPFNTQNYNRYGYCWNNPLKFSDPSGEWIWIAIGAVIGGVVNWAVHGCQFNAQGLTAFGIGAAAGALAGIVGPAAFSMAGGGAAGAGGFIAGAAAGAAGAIASQTVLTVGNHVAFGDPLMSGKEFIMGVAFGAVLGGTINGISAVRNGNTFWKGTPPRIVPPPISLPSVGLQTGTPQEPQVSTKLPSSSQPSTAPTTEANTTGKVTFTKNVDGNGYKVDGLGIVDDGSKSFFDNTQYTDKVLNQMKSGDFHSFPKSVEAFELDGTISTIKGGDGIFREMLKIPGGYKGREGFFEFLKESDGMINHRYFNPNR